MIIDIGYYALWASLVLTFYAVFASLAGIKRNSYNLIESGRQAHIGTFLLVTLSYLALTWAFITDEFTVKFVANNSSTDLPLFYKITAVWGGLDGSLLLWQFILSSFTAIIAIRYKNRNREMLPYILTVLSASTIFLLFLLIGWSNPFALNYPIPAEGRGLNPLLQNPGMVIHPPALYLGYVGFNVPFAFAMASLLSNRLSEEWILATRRWTLVSWFFLTAGMVLGGNWAYVELGWGGYWAWDPVENASLMPWLTGTAYLHSVIVQEKRNSLRLWNMMLIIGTFALSILGTFITRSGVLNSVHAFSKSNIGPAFLVYIAVILFFSHLLLFKRSEYFKGGENKNSFLCKENSFLFNNVLFVAMSFTVLYGTTFPLLAEGLANKKISIQAPFFNSIMLPMGLMMLFLMGLTQIMGWKKTSQAMLKRNSLIAGSTSLIVLVGGMAAFGWKWQLAFLAALGWFALYINLAEMFKSLKASARARKGDDKAPGLLERLKKDKRKRGGLIVHLGIAVMALGFCGNFFGAEDTFSLYPGQSKEIQGYTLTFERAVSYQALNARHEGANLIVSKNGQEVGKLTPVKAFYPTRPEPMTEVAIRRTIVEDLYISLASANQDSSVTLNVYVNPLVNLVWASMGFFVVGLFFSLSFKPAQIRAHKGEK